MIFLQGWLIARDYREGYSKAIFESGYASGIVSLLTSRLALPPGSQGRTMLPLGAKKIFWQAHLHLTLISCNLCFSGYTDTGQN